MGYVDGANVCEVAKSDPIVGVDPFGLLTWSTQRCHELLQKIASLAEKLRKEYAKFDPIRDAAGDFQRWDYEIQELVPGKPNGHRIEIENLRRGIRLRIQQYWENCKPPDCPKRDFKEVFEVLSVFETDFSGIHNNNLLDGFEVTPAPHPWYAKGGSTATKAIDYTGKGFFVVGVVSLTVATGGAAAAGGGSGSAVAGTIGAASTPTKAAAAVAGAVIVTQQE